ncbi:MAG: arsenate reductase [Bdellovibrionales bacterium CG12_big_fil_rev_8_21_14_0_65_38_15]|nr:MAG: arsenate reductase [Bdellovibrionales bacterium CG22_combo_CG10-13_8_21_14_all_38_13]PIQ57492.1 MAG: arsenate reductase [Bdellovibrionales bacterium CG12_big_fil_rev_8_21_14_0_65_38_15]PIR31213.1 MAG: arsenate reductase [Bdellovibrionales bacterium CG11_big_fil_rev_8_21_14_0_20_38_13]
MLKNILFLCTGNSCRSQMAEGWGKALSPEFNFFSAGTTKHGLNPKAIQVMKEVGVDISNNYSKTLDEVSDIPLELVVTVCTDADEKCPVLPGVRVIHQGFRDPPRLTMEMTNEEDILNIYREVRDEIKQFILQIDHWFSEI